MCFNLNDQIDFVTDHVPPWVHALIPGNIKILPVDECLSRDPDDTGTERAFDRAGNLNGDRKGFSDSFDG